MGGPRRQEGDVVVAANGYSYSYIKRGDVLIRILTHWLVAEKKYGRPATPDEKVRFKDGDRTNMSPENIIYVKMNSDLPSLNKRRLSLLDRIREATVELEEVEQLIKERTESNGA